MPQTQRVIHIPRFLGKIVDILIETKCMNPIIYIDELDKISQTENGREIIGILTHLTDSTQNDQFTDKYFAGIDIDLSMYYLSFHTTTFQELTPRSMNTPY